MEHTKELLSIDLSNLVPSPLNVRRHSSGQVEAGPDLAGGGVEAMKKDALVTAAASRLAGTRLLPEPLSRSPG
ncbi:MAG: hypothetical protein ABI702_22575 [Burkholderiales bacterium]